MKPETRRQWAERVKRWRASGQTAREFAAREGLSAGTLLWWSSALKREGRSAARFIEVVPARAPSEAAHIDIVVRERVRIRVSGGFDAVVLRRVVAALEAA